MIEQIQWEKELLERFSISQQLFDRTQRESTEERYSALAPSAATFQKYGYIAVKGTQDAEKIAKLNAVPGFPPVLYE